MKPRRSSGVACRIESSWPCPTMTCISRPMPESESSSWMSSSRQDWPLISYSEPPLRNMVRVMVTSVYSIGSAPSVLSMVSATSARPSGGRPEVPAKMTSSILPPRSDLAPCSPITQARASTTLDLPEPLGPTTQVMPGSSCSVVAEAKDLNPRSVRLLRYKVWGSSRDGAGGRAVADEERSCRGEVSRQHLTLRGPRYGAGGARPRRRAVRPGSSASGPRWSRSRGARTGRGPRGCRRTRARQSAR